MLPKINSQRSQSWRYRRCMGFPSDEWRRERMRKLAEKLGSKAELGRELGYADGAFVRQMIAGERPITEKTIQKAESIPGCKGWFDQFAPPPSPSDGREPFGALTDDERRFLADFRILLDQDREQCRKHVAEKAEQMREYLAKLGLPFNRNHLDH